MFIFQLPATNVVRGISESFDQLQMYTVELRICQLDQPASHAFASSPIFGEFLFDDRRDLAQLAHQLLEHLGQQRLRAVALGFAGQ